MNLPLHAVDPTGHHELDTALGLLEHVMHYDFYSVQWTVLASSAPRNTRGWMLHVQAVEDGQIVMIEFTTKNTLIVYGQPTLTNPAAIARWLDRTFEATNIGLTQRDVMVLNAAKLGWSISRKTRPAETIGATRIPQAFTYRAEVLNPYYNEVGHPEHRDTGAPMQEQYSMIVYGNQTTRTLHNGNTTVDYIMDDAISRTPRWHAAP